MKQKNKEQTLLSEAGIIDIIKTRSEDPVWYGSFLRSYYQGETSSKIEEYSNISEVISNKEITSDMLSTFDDVVNTPTTKKAEVKTRGRPKGSKSINKKVLKTISNDPASSSDSSEDTVKEVYNKPIKISEVSDSNVVSNNTSNVEDSKPLSAKAQAKAEERVEKLQVKAEAKAKKIRDKAEAKKLKAEAKRLKAEALEERRKERTLAREKAKAEIKALNRPRGRPRKNPVEFEEPYTGPVKKRSMTLEESNPGDYMVCFVCGKAHTMLKRHLKESHGLTENQYRAMYDLPDSYPMTAPNYSKRKKKSAELTNLGKHKRIPKESVNSSVEMEVEH